MGRSRVDAVDAIWLNMDRSNNLMVIESLVLLAGPVDWDRYLDVLRQRVVDRYPVFGRRPVVDRLRFSRTYWEDDPDFDLSRHVHRATLPEPGDDAALQRYVDGFVGRPLPRDRPLWQVHLVDGYAGASAVYTRLHHSLADGMALMQVLLSLTDATPDGDDEPQDEHHSSRSTLPHLFDLAGSTLRAAPHLLSLRTVRESVTLAEQTTSVARKLLLSRKPESPLAGRPGVDKRVLWSDPIPLPDVRRAGHVTGTTVNDLLVAALSGALATYLERHHGESVDIPTMVPVNLRGPDEPLPRDLGNRFALVLLSLPSALPTTFARLAETKRRMDAIKHSPEPALTFEVSRAIGRTGRTLEHVLVDFFANKAVGVTTNVAGPRSQRYLAGVPVTGLLGWAPESGDQTLGICIVTYAGTVRVGFKVDAWQVPAPEGLVDSFRDELEALLQLAAS